jgi:hypothetical protein
VTPPASPHAPAKQAAYKRLGALVALGVASVLYPKLAFPASVLCLIGGLSLPNSVTTARRKNQLLLGIAALLSGVGLLRFVLLEAIPGVVSGGRAAVEKQAVSYLRGIVTAQDHARRSASLDLDGDGVGAALSLQQLGGLAPVFRSAGGAHTLEAPPLAVKPGQLETSSSGTVLSHAGYLFLACIPMKGGGFSTQAVPDVDEERAERRYLLYAWPRQAGPGAPNTAYFADEHERILQLQPQANEPPRYRGLTRPPPCDSALEDPKWSRWKGKQARDHLPGASPSPTTH